MEGGILNTNAGSWAPPQFQSDSPLQEPGIMHFNQGSKGFDVPRPWTGWEALLQALPRGTSTNVIYLGLERSNFYIMFSSANGLFFFKFYLFIYLFIYPWLCWVFVSARGLSPVVASGGHSSSRCAGLSLSRPLLLRSTGCRRAGSVAVAHGPSRSAACGILPDQGSNPCRLHWQADSQPLRHQGSPLANGFLYQVPISFLHE